MWPRMTSMPRRVHQVNSCAIIGSWSMMVSACSGPRAKCALGTCMTTAPVVGAVLIHEGQGAQVVGAAFGREGHADGELRAPGRLREGRVVGVDDDVEGLHREADGVSLIEDGTEHLVGVVPHVLHVEERHRVLHLVEDVEVVEEQVVELHRVLQLRPRGRWHLVDRLEEPGVDAFERVGDGLAPELVEGRLAVEGVDDDLDGVARVADGLVSVERARARVALVAELVLAAEREAARPGDAVDHPLHAAVRGERERVGVEVEVRQDALDALERRPEVVRARLIGDEIGEQDLPELAADVAEDEALEQRVDVYAGVHLGRVPDLLAPLHVGEVELLHARDVGVGDGARPLAVVDALLLLGEARHGRGRRQAARQVRGQPFADRLGGVRGDEPEAVGVEHEALGPPGEPGLRLDERHLAHAAHHEALLAGDVVAQVVHVEELVVRAAVRRFGNAQIGFIGMTLEGTPNVVTAAGVEGLTFLDEAETANALVPELQALGVETIVVLVHEGGAATGAYNECVGVSGPLFEIVKRLDPAIDVVIAGHTNAAHNCNIDGKIVTSAAHNGRLVSDIDLVIDERTGDVKSMQSGNVIVARTGNRLRFFFLKKKKNFMNPGGIRVDLVASQVSGGEQPGEVTYGELFAVQPFSNNLVMLDLTGAQIERVLEEQYYDFGKSAARAAAMVLQVSQGFSYTVDLTKPAGERVDPASIKLGGAVLDATATYRVVCNVFLAGGGDTFPTFAAGTNRVSGVFDLEALEAYLTARPSFAAPTLGRILAP